MKAIPIDNKQKLFDKLNSFNSGNDSVYDEFIAMLSLPDEKFEAVYPELKNRFDAVFKSNGFQRETIQNLAGISYESIKEEETEVRNFLEEIKAEETLSEHKKELFIKLIENSMLASFEFAKLPRERVEVKVEKLDPDVQLPTYAHPTDAGADIYSNEIITIESGETKVVHTGIKVAIPIGYSILIYPRSGMSLRTGLRVANSVGVVDSDYRDEVGVIITNTAKEPYTINKGDRIAQMIIAAAPMITWTEEKLDTTNRGAGFGSSGI